MTFSDKVLDFTFSLEAPAVSLPDGVEWLFPYDREATRQSVRAFYQKYCADMAPRTALFGINPGRFGAGVTGVPFTDPVRLQTECGIDNAFDKKPELSSVFVWAFIRAFGGPEQFFSRFYITSLCPLGFVREGKNINYYDDKDLLRQTEPFIVWNIQTQMAMGLRREAAVCIGEGQNYRVFRRLNDAHGFFDEIIPLPHPRWVMQYRRKRMDEFVEKYVEVLERLQGR